MLAYEGGCGTESSSDSLSGDRVAISYSGPVSLQARSSRRGACFGITPPIRKQSLLSLACRNRFVGTERVGAERVAGVSKGTGARSATDVAVHADSAFAVKLIRI